MIRPKYNGVITFQSIRDASASEESSWEVDLEPGQTLKALDPQDAEVDYPSGHEAYLIAAEPAHDAVGTSVPTFISVSDGNVVTLTVRHRSGPFVYPVVAGAGWEGGYTTQILAGPKDEQELKEERERIQHEEQEQREREWEEEASTGSGSGDESPGEGLEEVHNSTPYRPHLMRMDVGAPKMYDWTNRKRRSKAEANYCSQASCDYWNSWEVGTWFWNGTEHVPGGFAWRGDTLSKCYSDDGLLFADNIINVGWAGPNPAPYGYGAHLNLWCNGDGYQKQHIHEYDTWLTED